MNSGKTAVQSREPLGTFFHWLSPHSPLQTSLLFLGSLTTIVISVWCRCHPFFGMGVPPLTHADKSGCKMKSSSAQLVWPFSCPLSSDWWDLNGLYFKSTAWGELCPKRTSCWKIFLGAHKRTNWFKLTVVNAWNKNRGPDPKAH